MGQGWADKIIELGKSSSCGMGNEMVVSEAAQYFDFGGLGVFKGSSGDEASPLFFLNLLVHFIKYVFVLGRLSVIF